MADFGQNQKYFIPIANGNVADSGMAVLTDEPLPKPNKEWKFKCKS